MTPAISLLFGLTAVVAIGMALLLLRHAGQRGARWFAVACLAVAAWSTANAVQNLTHDPGLKRFTVGLVFACISIAVYALWRAVIARAPRPWTPPTWLTWALALPGLLTAILATTTGPPGPFYRSLEIPEGTGPVTGQPAEMLVPHLIWANGLLIWSLAGIAHIVRRIPRQDRRWVIASVAAFALAPLVNMALFATELRLFDGNDLTPIAALPVAAVVVRAVRRADALDVDVALLPVARDTVVESMSDGVVVVDAHGRVVDLNPAAADLLGVTPSSAIGMGVGAVVPGWDDEHPHRNWEILPTDRRPDVVIAARGGGMRNATPGCLILLRDVTEQHNDRVALELSLTRHDHAARHDQLTGLPNRVALFWHLRTTLAEARPVTLLILDLNGFKALNDTFGHRWGDQVLRDLGGRLREAAPAGATVARLAGDEFAVVLDGAEERVVARVAQRMVGAIRDPFVIEGTEVSVGASIGASLGPRHGDDADTLVHAADVAMYHAKRGARPWALYEPGLDERRPDRLMLRHELRRAIGTEEIEVHLQPQASPGGQVTAMEALIRWRHPARGLLAPGAFLPACDDGDLMCRLTDAVLDAALAALRDLDRVLPGLRIAVNLSGPDIRDPSLPDRVGAALRRHRIDPGRLTLEVTENALVSAGDGLTALRTVRDLGVRVSLDDFGTGSGPLATLRELPVDELKIDRSFVAGIGRPREAALVAGLIRLAHDLGLTVIAEGVESADQAAALVGMGCDTLQGFHVGRPTPPRQLLREHGGAGAAGERERPAEGGLVPSPTSA